MIDHCRGHAALGWLGDVIVALACTGVRIGELASLKWGDVDLGNRQITLTDETGHRVQESERRTLKNGRSRRFPIHPDLLVVLNGLVRVDPYVFHGPRGKRLHPDKVRRILIRDVLTPLAGRFTSSTGNKSFLDGRLHSFRHYFISACAGNRVPERVVMEWVGHADSDMVRHYFHLHVEESKGQMNGVDFLGTAGCTSGDVSVSSHPN
ncbi:MAG: site-specific integrase [Planctomycetaceae bacterium]|nr:site-specific integrase [Planctomycetaceae bacterium]